jgi:hypothetical protein
MFTKTGRIYQDPATVQDGRRGEHLQCKTCGKRVERAARHQLYCSRKCRQLDNYQKAIAEGRRCVGNPLPARDTALPTHPPGKPLNGHDFLGRNSRPTPRINVVPRVVIETEIVAGRTWTTVVSPDGVRCQVAAALRRGRVS